MVNGLVKCVKLTGTPELPMTRFPSDALNVTDVAEFLALLPPVTEEQRQANIDAHEQAEREMRLAGGPLAYVHKTMEASMNRAMKVVGWALRNIPYTKDHLWNELIHIIGEDNIKIVSLSTRGTKEEFSRRGTLLISPEGIVRIERYAMDKKTEKEAPG